MQTQSIENWCGDLKIKAGFKVRSINRGNLPKYAHRTLSPYPHCFGTGSVPACRSPVSLGKERLGHSSGTLQALGGLMAVPCPHSSSFHRPALESSSPLFFLLLLLSRPLDNVTQDFSVCKSRAESFQLAQIPKARPCEAGLPAGNGCWREAKGTKPELVF